MSLKIRRYILGAIDKYLKFKPNNDLNKFELYVDAEFAGNHSKDTCEDPNYIEYKIGCVIGINIFAYY